MNVTETTIQVVGGLAIFLFGMKIMSEGLQKVAGPRMRRVLGVMTGNRFLGVGTGLLVTSAVQSSSATTVMLVGFVHAGLITLEQSIGVVMGANIGTTLTGWLVALLGFKVKIAAMALPAIALGFAPRLLGARRLADWGEVLVGFGILFLGLDFMKEAVGHLKESELIISWMANTRADVIGWRLVAVAVGTAVTFIVQSSSATMAITMTLAAQGLIDLPTACALVLGENIGTTITANLAALSAGRAAKETARAHFVFNLFGATWAVLLFGPFTELVELVVPGEAFGSAVASAAVVAAHLAAFHTLFNVINTGLFLPFTNQLAWIAKRLVVSRKNGTGTGLVYIDPKMVTLPPMALHAARSELGRMLGEVQSMLGRVLMLIATPDKKLAPVSDAVAASERIVDDLQREITAYLVAVSREGISSNQSKEINGIINAASDVERIGDHCESLLKLIGRRQDSKLPLSEQAIEDATTIGDRASEFLALLRANLGEPSADLMAKAHAIEESIDKLRWTMRERHVQRLRESTCEIEAGLIFIDMLTSFEKIGDHSYNVAQMLAGER